MTRIAQKVSEQPLQSNKAVLSRAVAYEYVNIPDVMVGQAPEYIGLIYGAIKILLVAQVNNEENGTNDRHVALAASDTDPRPNITDRLFFLFHGAPGMGRSLVAQCLANYARRPLFHVTSGTKAGEAKLIDSLRTVFELAKRWNCLVLVDHVETVLELRNFSDFDKNAVVTNRL
ncbi:hypothetical protein LA080_012409 [Diaporthe eres]|nr:hypothetical protein LA080_012409 [Diaporthe eres]